VRPRLAELARETLAVDVGLDELPPPGAHSRELEIDGEPLQIGLRLA
jgi:hypothetical protein